MVSHEHRLIFIHIPKSAGTSIELALGHHSDFKGRGRQDHRTIRELEPLPSLATWARPPVAKEIIRRYVIQKQQTGNPKNYLTVTAEQYSSYFKFTFVRNPWDRCYSVYRNIIRDPMHRQTWDVGENISLGSFLKMHIGKDMLRPQLHWITGFRGDVPMDFIGRFENLQNDFAKVLASAGVPKVELTHELKTPVVASREAFDNDTRELVGRFYKEEIALFNYEPS